MRRLSLAFMNVPLAGHLAAMESVMRACADAGHEVRLFGHDSMATLAARGGAAFEPYADQSVDYAPSKLGSIGPLFDLLMRFTEANLDDLVARLAALKPDCVIHDQFCPWAKYAAYATGLRAASSVTSMIFERRPDEVPGSMLRGLAGLEEGNAIRASLSERFRLPKWGIIDALQNKEGLNLLMRLRELQAGEFEGYLRIGPCLPERDGGAPTIRDPDRPLAYVSMGTVYAFDGDEAERAVRSLRAAGFRVVVAAGPLFGRLAPLAEPPFLEIHERCDQLEVLAGASVFLTHGGMNGTQEALYRGAIPLFRPLQDEQASIAEAVRSRGAGFVWDGASDLGALARRALEDASCHAAVAELGASLRERGAPARALAAIESYVGEGA